MKYYYGNSYKEAISNNPIEINDTRILEQYKACYSNVFPVEEEESGCSTETFYDVVYMYNDDDTEYTDTYDDRDEAVAAYDRIMQEIEREENSYNYVVLRRIDIDTYDDGTEEESVDYLKSYSQD